MRFIGRIAALIIGLIACAIALGVDVLYSLIHHAVRLAGDAGIDRTHGFVGFLLVLVGVLGSILALFAPTVAAVLLLIAGIGMFFVVKAYAVLSIVFFVIAALLAYVDRSRRQTA